MTNAEARFNNSLHPRKPEGSLGRIAQDVHLDSHTAPELCLNGDLSEFIGCRSDLTWGIETYVINGIVRSEPNSIVHKCTLQNSSHPFSNQIHETNSYTKIKQKNAYADIKQTKIEVNPFNTALS